MRPHSRRGQWEIRNSPSWCLCIEPSGSGTPHVVWALHMAGTLLGLGTHTELVQVSRQGVGIVLLCRFSCLSGVWGGHLCRPYIALHCRVSMLLLLLAAVKTYFKTQVWQDEVRTHSVRLLHSSWQCIVCRWVISLLLSIYVVGGYLVRSYVFTILIKCIKGHKSLGSLCCCGFKQGP